MTRRSSLTYLEQLMMMEAIHRRHSSTMEFLGLWDPSHRGQEPDDKLRERLCRLFESPKFAKMSPQQLMAEFQKIRKQIAAEAAKKTRVRA